MGYTHYCYKPTEIPLDKWRLFVTDFKKILPNFEHLLDKTTDQKLSINDDEVLFNGIGEESHETFCLERVNDTDGESFSFCKTARKPYDIAVCCALIVGKRHMPITVRSDGDAEWEDARIMCQEKLGYGGLFKLDR